MELFWFQILASTFSPQAVARTCSVEKVFLKNLQNSLENNCTGISCFNEVAGPATLFKKRLCAQVFSCKFCENSKSTFL